jgi:mono/diheme cytochrome c family protein
MRRALALVLAGAAAAATSATACSKGGPGTGGAGTADAGAGTADGGVTMRLSTTDGRALLTSACLSCHSEEMIAQQRLTPAQWSKVVTKMVGWGANLAPDESEPLATWLATTYGTDAGPWEPQPLSAAAATAELVPLTDGPFANGDPERGHALYMDRCAACHGPEARGQLGVRLIDRPLLRRASEVAETVRRGRGKMPPLALADGEIADLLAHLRRLH